MKLSNISMMTLAAMYAGSAAMSAASPLTQTPRPLEITEQIKQFNANKNKDRLSGNAIQANRTSNGRNVHRAITLPGTDKLPFAFEQGLTGEQNYIIRLSDSPVSLYQGGSPACKPPPRAKTGSRPVSACSNTISWICKASLYRATAIISKTSSNKL